MIANLSRKGRIYLDHNATSPLRRRVREAMIETMDIAGNPSSVHTEGRKARGIVERAREKIAALVGADSRDVIFTSGGTEANMTALSPGLVAKSARDRQRALCFVSAIEHPSVLSGGRFDPAQIRIIPVTPDGIVDIEAFVELLDRHHLHADNNHDRAPFIVSVMLANNETGVVQPVTEIAAIVLERGGLMHSDAAQALGRMPFDMGSVGVDLVTINAHKIGGPKGVGALVGPGIDNVLNDPLLTGGGQEMRRRAGTEDVVSIAGFAVAAEISCEELADREMVRFLRDRFESRLTRQYSEMTVFGRKALRLDNTSLIAIPGVRAENMVIALDLDGIAISSGSACSSGKVSGSHVLEAMGVAKDLANCAFRISFGPQNWLNDIDAVVASIGKVARQADKLQADRADMTG